MSDNELERVILNTLTTTGASKLRKWIGDRRPSTGRLVRGAAAGAAAAGIVAVFHMLAQRERPGIGEFVDRLLAGAGRGIIYTAVLDPLLPGPPAVRGALTGTAEYLTAPWGGVLNRLSALSPVERIPIVGALLDAGEAEEDPFIAWLLFGLALGLLTGDDD